MLCVCVMQLGAQQWPFRAFPSVLTTHLALSPPYTLTCAPHAPGPGSCRGHSTPFTGNMQVCTHQCVAALPPPRPPGRFTACGLCCLPAVRLYRSLPLRASVLASLEWGQWCWSLGSVLRQLVLCADCAPGTGPGTCVGKKACGSGPNQVTDTESRGRT